MATIYLSFTYEDLKAYREEAYKALRKSRHDVIAMEDYVATDQRPVDQCFQDVEKADIYVGLFAFRYGYIPPPEHNNPHGLSITELELRQAMAKNKPCLIFLLEEKKKNWPAEFMDVRTENDKGKRIETLRADLRTQKLVSFFSTPQRLATEVLAALMNTEATRALIISRTSEHDQPPAVTWDIEKKRLTVSRLAVLFPQVRTRVFWSGVGSPRPPRSLAPPGRTFSHCEWRFRGRQIVPG
jgi:Domain of unknown function (DUF4062)